MCHWLVLAIEAVSGRGLLSHVVLFEMSTYPRFLPLEGWLVFFILLILAIKPVSGGLSVSHHVHLVRFGASATCPVWIYKELTSFSHPSIHRLLVLEPICTCYHLDLNVTSTVSCLYPNCQFNILPVLSLPGYG
jgi:hypothetical protein